MLPKASIGLECYTNPDTDAAYENADLEAAQATDAAIGDLTPVERAAIHHAYLDAVYRFPREQFEVVLARAEQRVQESLERKGVFVRILDLRRQKA